MGTIARGEPKPGILAAAGPRQAQSTIGLISVGGGNFDNLVEKQFIGRFTRYTINQLSDVIIKIPTTRYQTYCADVGLPPD